MNEVSRYGNRRPTGSGAGIVHSNASVEVKRSCDVECCWQRTPIRSRGALMSLLTERKSAGRRSDYVDCLRSLVRTHRWRRSFPVESGIAPLALNHQQEFLPARVTRQPSRIFVMTDKVAVAEALVRLGPAVVRKPEPPLQRGAMLRERHGFPLVVVKPTKVCGRLRGDCTLHDRAGDGNPSLAPMMPATARAACSLTIGDSDHESTVGIIPIATAPDSSTVS